RPARAVEVEHAAGGGRGCPELDLARLGGECKRLLRSDDVDALVDPAGTRIAEVVDVVRRAEDREDDRLGRVAGAGGRRPGQQAGNEQEEESSSGCRPVASHELRVALEEAEPNNVSGG